MTFPTKLAFIHPIWFLVLTVVAFVAPLFDMNADSGVIIARALMTVWLLLLPLGWAYGIYLGSRAALARIGAVSAGRDWVFQVAGIGLVGFPILGFAGILVEAYGGVQEGFFGLVMFVVIASYFASLWLASAALVAFEDGTPKIASHKVVGTFLLMAYWIIGAWVMHGRLKRLREAITVGGSSAAQARL